jgi:glycosyltransferase involved in cell wall biosynthesis
MKNPKSISLMFPLYNDKRTVKIMITKSLKILKKINKKFEIIIVDDGCPEKSGKIAQIFSKKNPQIKVFFHKKNLGYGYAIKTGLKKCKNECVFLIDGDNEYDVNDLPRMLKAFRYSDLVITYRYKKKYKTYRIIISWIYNKILRILFATKFKDISTGSRLLSRELKNEIKISSCSPFLGAELAIKSMQKGFTINEIGIHTYPRTFGNGSSVSLKNIFLTIKDMLILFIKLCLKKNLGL